MTGQIVFDHDPAEKPARWRHRATGVEVRQIVTVGRSFYSVWKPTPTGELLFGSAAGLEQAWDIARAAVRAIAEGRIHPRILT